MDWISDSRVGSASPLGDRAACAGEVTSGTAATLAMRARDERRNRRGTWECCGIMAGDVDGGRQQSVNTPATVDGLQTSGRTMGVMVGRDPQR